MNECRKHRVGAVLGIGDKEKLDNVVVCSTESFFDRGILVNEPCLEFWCD